jgi:hypothetical protein
MLENIEIRSASLSFTAKSTVFPITGDNRLIAAVHFKKQEPVNQFRYLSPVIGARLTNRNVSERKPLNPEDAMALQNIAATIPGASLRLYETEACLREFDELLTNTERLRFLHPRGHYDTFIKELRFSKEEVETTADGLDVSTLNLKQSDIAALTVARDPGAISLLHRLQQGSGFKKISSKNILTASAIGVISMEQTNLCHYVQGGRALERIWLEANFRKIAFQPVSQIIFMLELFRSQGSTHFNDYEQEELRNIHQRFSAITNTAKGQPVFVFRLCHAGLPETRSLRRPLKEMFFVK